MRTLKKAITETRIAKPKATAVPEEDLNSLYNKVCAEDLFLADLKSSDIEDVASVAEIVYDLLAQGLDWSCSRVQMSTELLYRAMLKNGFIREEGNS